MSNRSRSSSRSRSGTPTKKGTKSLNYAKRVRSKNAISAENMRFVAKLINVKPTVPSGIDLVNRDIK